MKILNHVILNNLKWFLKNHLKEKLLFKENRSIFEELLKSSRRLKSSPQDLSF